MNSLGNQGVQPTRKDNKIIFQRRTGENTSSIGFDLKQQSIRQYPWCNE
jgi:hypothetical protein